MRVRGAAPADPATAPTPGPGSTPTGNGDSPDDALDKTDYTFIFQRASAQDAVAYASLDGHVHDVRDMGFTSNVNMALSIANRGYVLQMGEVVLAGTAKVLLENPLIQKAYLGTA